jgi:hypothetical protein
VLVLGNLRRKKDQPPIPTDDAASTPARADQVGEVHVDINEASTRRKRRRSHQDAFGAEEPAKANGSGAAGYNVVPKK